MRRRGDGNVAPDVVTPTTFCRICNKRLYRKVRIEQREIALLIGAFTMDPLEGAQGQLIGRLDSHFVHDVRAMSLDGFHAQVEFICNLTRRAARADQAEYFQFAVAQTLNGRLRKL